MHEIRIELEADARYPYEHIMDEYICRKMADPWALGDVIKRGRWFLQFSRRWEGFAMWRIWDGSVRVNMGFVVLCGNVPLWE